MKISAVMAKWSNGNGENEEENETANRRIVMKIVKMAVSVISGESRK